MIYIKKLIKTVGTEKLFEIDNFTISDTDKIGLIGDNGVGKSTLLRILIGKDHEYQGNVEIKTRIDYLLNDEFSDTKVNDEIYSRAHLYLDDDYSPGEFQRLKLTRLLSDESKYILIDEPTSHLDIEYKDKLIEDLNSRKLGYIIVSHDRDFINRTCNIIIEISNKILDVYNGNYEFYLDEKIRRNKFKQKEYNNYINEKHRLENLAVDIKQQSSKVRTAPKRMGNSEARLHKMGGQENKKKLDKQVKAIKSRMDQLEVKEKPKEETIIELSVPDVEKIYSKILIRAENLNKSFGEKEIFSNANFAIKNSSKIALIGNNGSGKTTLLKMILNREDVWVHPNLKIGYFSQMGEILNLQETILENVLVSSIYNQTMTRIVLARLGFRTESVLKKVRVLSDGERSKVKLAKLLTSDFNYLIFDEPTNYLDINSIEALEDLLSSYDRAFIFVTHDVSFINNIANSLLIIENNKIISFEGNLQEYRDKKKSRKDNTNEDKFIIDFKLSTINSKLTMEIPKEEREELEEEYERLLLLKNGEI